MNTMYTKRMAMAFSLCCSAVVLVACGSSGSSVSGTSTFTSFSAIQPNSTVTIKGSSQNGTFTNNAGVITTEPAGEAGEATVEISTDASGNTTAVKITPANGSPISLSRTTGSTSEEETFGDITFIDIDSSDDQQEILLAKASSVEWDYQTFGRWENQNIGSGASNSEYGVFSVGAATVGSNIPTSGTATYNGYTAGNYFSNNSNQKFETFSSMTASVNFSEHNINFTTTGTRIEGNDGTFLDITGTMSYEAASNQITGNVNISDNRSGTVNARFYGPNAEEIGGTFAIAGNTSRYVGAFGGKR